LKPERPPGPNHEDIRRFFRLLSHGQHGLTELRIIPSERRPHIGFFDDEDAFVETCTRWSGRANVYAGRNPRPRRFVEQFPQAHNKLAQGIPGARSADIEIVTALSIDIDPRRPRNTSSTSAEHDVALAVADRVASDYPGAILVDSGNGAQVLFPLSAVSVNGDARRVEAQTKAWESEVRTIVEEDPGLRLDSIYDLARVIKVPGTVAIKGTPTPERPHRLARIVGEIPSEPCDMHEVFEREVDESEADSRELAAADIPERFRGLLESDERIRRTWNGERGDLRDSTGSGYDMAMIDLLLGEDFTPEEVLATVLAMPSGTKDTRRVAYSIRKAERDRKPTGKRKKDDVLAADAADDFLAAKGLRGKLRRWRGDWWLYNGRCYDALSDEECRSLIVAYLRDHPDYRSRATRNFAGNVLLNLESLGALPDSLDLPFWVSSTGCERKPNLVALQNGVVDVERFAAGHLDVLQKHTPEFFCPTLLPYAFDPQAPCLRWREFLDEVLPEADGRQFLQEWFGYNLVYDLSQQRFVILEGDGANGKSVICTVLRQLLGAQNVSAVPLEFFEVRFQLAPTLGKLANVVPEMGEIDRVAEGVLKPFVSGDPMQFDRKNKEPITALPTARLTFATNMRPRFSDRSEGVWRRLVLVPFTVTIPPDRQDRKLGEKLIAELPGIFNWAIQGLQRLRERGHLIEPTASREAKEDYKRETNPARAFLEEKCEVDPRHEIPKEALYGEYRTWAEACGYRPLGLAQFAKEVHRLDPSIRAGRPRQDGKRTQVFEGIELGKGGDGQGGQSR
jgi:P4 family phage/plasmid primase-like protien